MSLVERISDRLPRHRVVASAPALAGPGGIPGPNPDAPGQVKKANGPTINTGNGPVRGFVNSSGVNEFLGIPYAAPPTGNLRWMPPAPPANHALLDATEFANSCPQVTELGAFAGPSSTTEDCLYLNVFTTGTSPAKPVLVWIHGGGNVDGETADYDASKLAKNGIVVVTINYRMGLFGFIASSELGNAGNYGILDQQAALRWVQANVAAFGGDPTKVALGGQSAGSQDTSANLISPGATGLFNRAINQSSPTANLLVAPPTNPTWTSLQTALDRGNRFAAAAGCTGSAACLRALTAARILQLQGTPNANGPYVTGPFVDGTIIPIQPETAWSTGNFHHMPIMGGAVKEESNFGESIREYFSGPPQAPLTAAQYTSLVNATYVPPLYVAGTAAQVLLHYPPGSDPSRTYSRSFTDPGKCRSLHVLSLQANNNGGNSVYGYDFTYQNAPYYFPQMPNANNVIGPAVGYFQPQAAHTIDIQFLFDNWHGGNLGVNISQTVPAPGNNLPRELQGPEIGLSDQLVAAWTNFTKTGNPNGGAAPTWIVYTSGTPSFLQEDIPSSNESAAAYNTAYQCTTGMIWNNYLLYPTI
jgi:para-nitrobenzyl esterase